MRVVRRSDVVFAVLLAVGAGAAVGVASAQQLGAGVGAALGVLVAALVLAAAARRPRRRLQAARRPLSEEDRVWLRRHVPLYARADAGGKARFERDVQIALAELRFEGVRGAEPKDRLRLSVAAGAALLLHGRPDWELPAGRTVLFYPDRFDDQYDLDDGGTFDGMVHPQGPILLTVSAVEEGWARRDGYNVVLHELAHLFDFAGGAFADGVPSLMDAASTGAWQALVREEMRRAQLGKGVLSRYASTAPAELFAVATEQFFERPARLRRHHPRLFDALVQFYRLDPTPPDGEDDVEAPSEGESLMSRRWLPEEGEA